MVQQPYVLAFYFFSRMNKMLDKTKPATGVYGQNMYNRLQTEHKKPTTVYKHNATAVYTQKGLRRLQTEH